MADIALVTGASGFVGSAVARALLARGLQVRVLMRPTADRRNIADLDCEPIPGDMRDEASMTAAMAGARYVFHVAADYRLWAPDPREIERNNLLGAQATMNAALTCGVERVVYTSSVAALKPGSTAVDESSRHTPQSVIGAYKRSKLVAEREVERLVREKNLPAVIVAPSTPIGPRDIKPTPTGKMVVDAASGRMPAYVDTGLNVVHVDDVAEGHILAFERGRIGRNYILGSENMSLAEILGLVAAMTHRRPPRIKLPHGLVIPIAGLAEIGARLTGREPFTTREAVKLARKTMFFTSDRAIEELGYRPRPAREAIADAIAWFREHGYVG
jgi:dihydroflavonol-4-reductase